MANKQLSFFFILGLISGVISSLLYSLGDPDGGSVFLVLLYYAPGWVFGVAVSLGVSLAYKRKLQLFKVLIFVVICGVTFYLAVFGTVSLLSTGFSWLLLGAGTTFLWAVAFRYLVQPIAWSHVALLSLLGGFVPQLYSFLPVDFSLPLSPITSYPEEWFLLPDLAALFLAYHIILCGAVGYFSSLTAYVMTPVKFIGIVAVMAVLIVTILTWAEMSVDANKSREGIANEMMYVSIAEKTRSPEFCRKIYPFAQYPVRWGGGGGYYLRSACLLSVAILTGEKALCEEVRRSSQSGDVTEEICKESIDSGRYLTYGTHRSFGTNLFDKRIFLFMGYTKEDVASMIDEISPQWKDASDKKTGYDLDLSRERRIWRTYQAMEKEGFTLDGFTDGLAEDEEFGWVDEELLFWQLLEHKFTTDPDFLNRLGRLPDLSDAEREDEARDIFEEFGREGDIEGRI